MSDYIKKFNLIGKTVLINGGFGLIGFEISLACLSAGAQLVVIDKNKLITSRIKKIKKKYPNKVEIFNFDTSNYLTIEKNFEKIAKKFNKIDIFINTSYPKDKNWNRNTFDKIKINSFRKNIDLNMISYAWLTKLVANQMKKQKIYGSIILLGSIYGLQGQDLSIYKNTDIKENMTYSIIKGGITNLTKQMASYYGQYNIRINTLCPGGVIEDRSGVQKQNKTFLKNYASKVPLGRLAKSSEIATCALFLASEASSYVTGAVLTVDGGWTAI